MEYELKLSNSISKFIKLVIFWDWNDFGVGFRICRFRNKINDYKFSIDIQIGWFELWVECWRK